MGWGTQIEALVACCAAVRYAAAASTGRTCLRGVSEVITAKFFLVVYILFISPYS